MEKKIPIKTLYLIAVITIGLVGLGIGSTFAMFTASASINNPISLSTNLNYGDEVIETIEVDIDGNSDKTVTLNITNNTSSNLNYTCFYISDDPIKLGTNLAYNTVGTINASSNISIDVTIRNNSSSGVKVILGVMSGGDSIVLSNDMHIIPNSELSISLPASEMISNLFSKTGTVTNNGITYDIDSAHGLIDTSMMYKDLGDYVVVYRGDINCDGEVTEDEGTYILYHSFFGDTDYPLNTLIADVDGDGEIIDADASYAQHIANGEAEKAIVSIPKTSYGATSCILNEKVNQEIRYYGQEPNNYIDIGDNVLWRIIGVFDGKLKLIRNESIGDRMWDDNKNDWSISDLKEYLNNGIYYNNTITQSAKEKIQSVTWNLGGYQSFGIYPNQTIAIENGANVYTGNSIAWTGNIALPNASDYAYATNLLECNKMISNYSSSDDNYACRRNDWLWYLLNGISGSSTSSTYSSWILASYTRTDVGGWIVGPSGNMVTPGTMGVMEVHETFPVLYTKSNIKITGGTGTSSDPYRLS